MVIWCAFLALGAPCVGQTRAAAERPEELKRMLASRSRLFDTAMIEWSLATPEWTVDFTSRYAGGDHLLVKHPPPAEGFDGTPAEPYTYSARMELYTADRRQWIQFEGALSCLLRDASAETRIDQQDIRTIGFAPRMQAYDSDAALDPSTVLDARFPDPPDSYSVAERPDGLRDITATWSAGKTVTWRVDPERDWSPVFTQMTRVKSDGSVTTWQSYLTLRRVNDRWFTDEVRFLRDGRETHAVSVNYAEFDEPFHPARLDIADSLDIVTGVNVSHITAGGWCGQWEIFDGHKNIPLEEYNRKVEEGVLDHTEFERRLDAHLAEYPGVRPKVDSSGVFVAVRMSRRPGLWEPYTRSFIRAYGLTIERTEYAWKILRKAQAKAHEFLGAHGADLKELDRRRREVAREDVDERDPQAVAVRKAKLDALDQRRDHVLEPVDRIFKDMLQSGLYGLLTPAQRAGAQSAARGGDGNHGPSDGSD